MVVFHKNAKLCIKEGVVLFQITRTIIIIKKRVVNCLVKAMPFINFEACTEAEKIIKSLITTEAQISEIRAIFINFLEYITIPSEFFLMNQPLAHLS